MRERVGHDSRKEPGGQADGRNLVSHIVLAEAHPYDDELLRGPVHRRLDETMLRKLDIRGGSPRSQCNYCSDIIPFSLHARCSSG